MRSAISLISKFLCSFMALMAPNLRRRGRLRGIFSSPWGGRRARAPESYVKSLIKRAKTRARAHARRWARVGDGR
jgi:hypothetical protein